MAQTLLFPDPKPLDERLGRKFFRRAPRRPGVYLMKDANDRVLYVGKAKDLKQRLGHYRLANPDRLPRRHLRLVREVARIEFQFCANESAALRRESKLLRALKPKFNRAGVWPGKTSFIVWRGSDQGLELGSVEIPEPDWHRFGPLPSSARALHHSLCRLLWLALNPLASMAALPVGWAQGRLSASAAIPFDSRRLDVIGHLDRFFYESSDDFLAWLETQFCARTHPFERAAIIADLEQLQDFSQRPAGTKQPSNQLGLL
ncbi:hypothetical protein SBV1_590024 [Verrucomicrobia bacterium]|nr:hypothetical protein SBV1_590024 [Verrucomicrobiota bacterium]